MIRVTVYPPDSIELTAYHLPANNKVLFALLHDPSLSTLIVVVVPELQEAIRPIVSSSEFVVGRIAAVVGRERHLEGRRGSHSR